MLNTLPLRQSILAAGAALLLTACDASSEDGGFKDDIPDPGAAQLVLDVTDIHVAVMESYPLQIHISADGHVRTGGWTDAQLVLDEEASTGVMLVYRFMATPPTGLATQAITPIQASVTYGPWTDRAGRVIRVVADTNSLDYQYPN